MGSKTFDGVWFIAWSDDHTPLHLHGTYAGVELVVNLDVTGRKVTAAERERYPKPRNAKQSDVKHILRTAERHFDELIRLAEDTWTRRKL